MVDVATLTFRADTKDLANASASLDTLTSVAKRTSLQASQLKVQIAQVDLALKTLKASGSASKESINMLNNEMATLKLRLAEAKTMTVQTAHSIDQLKGFSSTAGHSVGNLSAQLFDIGVMMQSGQNPFVLMAQQGSQIAQILGPMGVSGAMATLKASVAQLLSPMNLAIFAVVGLSAVLVPMAVDFFAGKDAVDAYKASVEALTEATEKFADSAVAASESIVEMIDKYGTLTNAAAAALNVQAENDKAAALEALRTNVSALALSFGGLVQQEQYFLGSIRSFIPAFEELQNKFNFTEAAASQFLARLRELETATGPVEAAMAAQSLRSWLEQAYGSVDKMPPRMRAFYDELNNSVLAAASLQGSIDLANGVADKVRQTAAGIVAELDAASQADLAYVFTSAMPAAASLLKIASDIKNQFSAAIALNDAIGSVNRAGLASQYAQYGTGRAAFEPAAKENSALYTPFDCPTSEDFGGAPKRRPVDWTPTDSLGERSGEGGGGASEREKEAAAVDKVVESLRNEIAVVGQSESARRLHQELQRAGVDIYSQEGQQIAALVEELTLLEEKQKLVAETMEGIESAAQGFFVGVLSGAKDLKSAIGDLLRELGNLFLNQAFKMLWNGTGGGGGLGSLFAGLFDAGGRIPAGQVGIVGEKRPEFVDGKLVTRPTLVPGPANVTGGAATAGIMAKAARAAPSYGGGSGPRVQPRETPAPRVTVTPPEVVVLSDPREIDAYLRSPKGERTAAWTKKRLGNG